MPDACPKVQWLTPGFINAHCHLEYTWLRDKLPRGDVAFGDWLTAIMQMRPSTDADAEHRATAMGQGATELLRGGCTTVIDSTTDGISATPLHAAGVRCFQFREVLGLTRERAEPILRRATSNLPANGAGLNPHAPYSVGPWLRDQLGAVSPAVPIAWHLAETADEEQLFRDGSGSIARFLSKFSLPFPYDALPESSSFRFFADNNLADSCVLAFHGDQLADAEVIHFRAPRGLVHCPGTRHWFQRPPVPLPQWLEQGVNVCLGTDSLASSDSLSMLDMIRLVATDYPALSADQLLRMACSNPAALPFLQAMELTGTLETGATADFVALRSPASCDTWDALLQSPEGAVDKVFINGEQRYPQGSIPAIPTS